MQVKHVYAALQLADDGQLLRASLLARAALDAFGRMLQSAVFDLEEQFAIDESHIVIERL